MQSHQLVVTTAAWDGDGQQRGGREGWMGGWVDGCMDGWVGGRVGGWMDGRVGGWAGGWMGGWTGGWMISSATGREEEGVGRSWGHWAPRGRGAVCRCAGGVAVLEQRRRTLPPCGQGAGKVPESGCPEHPSPRSPAALQRVLGLGLSFISVHISGQREEIKKNNDFN